MTIPNQRKNRVLIVDDEMVILDNLSTFLQRSGLDVETAENGRVGLEKAKVFRPDVIVLDVLMPELDGRQMLRILRDNGDWTPIILLTEVGDATDRALALTEGADDYLNKPYDPHELVARIQSIIRRARKPDQPLNSLDVLVFGQLQFDRRSRIASIDEQKLSLTPRSTHLLEFLMLHPNELLTRERILNAVWGWNFVTGTRSVDARIVEVRKAIANITETVFIETVSGEGYRFCEPVN